MFANVSGNTSVALISPGDNISNSKIIHISNTHATDAVGVDLYIGKLASGGVASSTYHLVKSVKIAKSGYFSLESDILSFRNNSSTGFGLFIVLNNADSSVDVLIK